LFLLLYFSDVQSWWVNKHLLLAPLQVLVQGRMWHTKPVNELGVAILTLLPQIGTVSSNRFDVSKL